MQRLRSSEEADPGMSNDDHLIGPDMRRAAPTGVPGMYRIRLTITPLEGEPHGA